MLCYDREMWRRAQACISKMAFEVGIKEIPKLSLFLSWTTLILKVNKKIKKWIEQWYCITLSSFSVTFLWVSFPVHVGLKAGSQTQFMSM